MELQANNLRIGNLVNRTNKLTKEKLEIELTASCILDISANAEISSFVYEPIPVTEEWLLKFGISKWILDGRFEVRLNEAYGISIYAWQSGNCIFICHLDYVHQFQNWYYLHSKEKELTLNLSL